MTFAERLKEERKKAGLSQKDFAEKLGLNARTYASYERGERDISTSLLLNICTTLNISSDTLLGNQVPTQNPYHRNATPESQVERSPVWAEKSEIEIVSSPQIKQIPVIGRVAAGLQCFADMQIDEYAPCDASLLHTGYDYVYLRVTGDSMEPELHEGDKVLVQVRDTVESGDYAVVIVDGDDGLVKKVEYTKTQLTLISENPYYPPRRFQRDEMNRVRIFGKVVGLSRSF